VLPVSAVVAWNADVLRELYAGLLGLPAAWLTTTLAAVVIAAAWWVAVGYNRRSVELAELIATHHDPVPVVMARDRHRRRWAGLRGLLRGWLGDRAFRRACRRAGR
jgi:hypothetical protein